MVTFYITFFAIRPVVNIITFQQSSDSKHEELLKRITESGPDAFQDLVDICESNFWDAADFLTSFKKPERIVQIGYGRAFASCRNQTDPVKVEKDGIISSFFKRDIIPNIQLELFTDDSIEDETMRVTKAVRFCSGNILTYPMMSKNRGVLFFVNIIEIQHRADKYRHGAELDKMKLITLFREFGFKIFYYENVTLKVGFLNFIF